MIATRLLDRLAGVRPRGQGAWQALCPAHEDRSPSLSIHETPEGVLLIHCFAGCSPVDVVRAVGLELSDLYPQRYPDSEVARQRRSQLILNRSLRAALRLHLARLAIGTVDLAAGKAMSPFDQECLLDSVQFLQELLNAVEEIP